MNPHSPTSSKASVVYLSCWWGAVSTCPKEHFLVMQIEITDDLVKRAVRAKCLDCGGYAHHYMVHNAVWDAAWQVQDVEDLTRRKEFRNALAKRGAELFPEAPRWTGLERKYNTPHAQVWLLICFSCLERRLNRPLVIDDFIRQGQPGTSLPINDSIFFGYALAVKEMSKLGDNK